jgi:hypothetical protein
MPYGFELYNSSGEVIADSASQTMVLVESGSVTTTAGGSGTISYTNRSSAIPLILVQNGSGSPAPFLSIASITSTSALITAWNGAATLTMSVSKVASTINYRIYHKADVSPNGTGNYGIRLFDSAGLCTFDSRQEQMLLNSVMGVTTPAVISGSQSLVIYSSALPSGATGSSWYNLHSVSAAGYQNYTGGGSGSNLYGHACRINTNMQVAYVGLAAGIPVGGSTWTAGRNFFIVNS